MALGIVLSKWKQPHGVYKRLFPRVLACILRGNVITQDVISGRREERRKKRGKNYDYRGKLRDSAVPRCSDYCIVPR